MKLRIDLTCDIADAEQEASVRGMLSGYVHQAVTVMEDSGLKPRVFISNHNAAVIPPTMRPRAGWQGPPR